MPASLLVLGALSIAMLVWADGITRRQREHALFVTALRHIRLSLATGHVWVEEAVAGGGREVMSRAWADFLDASRVVHVLRYGGECEPGSVVPSIDAPEFRTRIEHLQRLVGRWGAVTRERAASPEVAGEGSALEQEGDEVFDEFQRSAAELERLVEDSQRADYARSRRLYAWSVVAWAAIVLASLTALWRRERKRRQTEAALRSEHDVLEARVAERTRELRQLSARLLTAQETERKRVSTELHDELGHALILLKFRVRLLARNAAQPATGDACRDLLQAIDQIIEDVRRLSRDLAPAVLEDLGLSATLRQLARNYATDPGTTVVASSVDVDDLVGPEARVLVYRVVQEAFTNAGKHAGARRVSLAVQRDGDRLTFAVQDDGKGFDVEEALARDVAQRGLGVATMHERARMLGGELGMRSRHGEGTCVTLTIPVQRSGGRS